MEFLEEMNCLIEDINNYLDEYIEKYSGKYMYDPIIYSVNSGGKRFRPILLLSMAESFSGNYKDAIPFAVAIECIHTYSLIHDDLPSMDNDDFRRGLPTCHKKFDEATAILAGDGLLNMAFEIMIDKIKQDLNIKYLTAMAEIAKSAGTKGMISGQFLDIVSENKIISQDDLFEIYENKTGKLIIASIKAGAVIGGAPSEILKKLEKIAYNIGIAFQIKDDILDLTGDLEKLGKPIMSDVKNQKSTYVSINGLEKSKNYYEYLSNKVLIELSNIGFQEKFIYKYIKMLIHREN